MVAAAALHHVEGEHRHHEERNGLQRAEHAADPMPVARHADEEEVVAGAENAAHQRKSDDHVKPFVDHFAVNAGGLDQHIGQQSAQDQLPSALHPKVNDEPPVHLVAHEIVRVHEAEQEHQRQAPQAHQQDHGNRGLAPLEHRHADVEEKAQRHDHDAHLGRQWLLQKLAPHGLQPVVAGEFGQLGIGHREVTHDGQAASGQENPEQQLGQKRRVQLGLRFLGHHVVARAHETEEQPDDEQVGVDHAGHVERDIGEKQIPHHVLQAERDAKNDLGRKQHHRSDEVVFCDRLALVFECCDGHVGSPISLRCSVASFRC